MSETIKVDYNGFEASVLGKDLYKMILSRHNIFTKKHTPGRVIPCKKELKEAVEYELANKKKNTKKESA